MQPYYNGFYKTGYCTLEGQSQGYSYHYITHPAIESDLNKIQSVSPEFDLD